MSVPAIAVRGLGKQYRLRHQQAQYGRLTESISSLIRAPIDRLRGKSREEVEMFWALRDVDFDVEVGEVLGIIGRNGAGKSTLLKVLSRVTEPSAGRAELVGRVSSLLEVGTGFHPELTGRENIYLSGSILGMRREETKRRFDEIVEFAGVDRFLDTPVKRFSSGMQVRLGFAVAAHLEPEILIVDEVLAVGDAAFQRKCVAKMGDVASEGRTVLVVSHNMATVDGLCSRAIRLEQGRVEADGNPSDVIDGYLRSTDRSDDAEASLIGSELRAPGMNPYLTGIRVLGPSGRPCATFMQGDPITIELDYDATACLEPLAGAGFNIVTGAGVRVGGYNTYMSMSPPHRIPQAGKVSFRVTAPVLTPGTYRITPSLGTHPVVLVDRVDYPLSFTVESRDVYKTGYLLTPADGVVALECGVVYEPDPTV